MSPQSPRVALDSSVVVAALLAWHERHDAARAELEEVLSSEGGVVLPVNALLEAYSVMTRLPSPHRLSPEHAMRLLELTFRESGRLVGPPEGEDAWGFVQSLRQRGIAGGRVYDALIAACARRGGADRILTLNLRHFEGLDPGLSVLVP